jgi:hypothetical protein
VQSGSMPPVRKGHLEWLRRARRRGHGQRASGPALHLPLRGSRLRAHHSRTERFVGAIAVGLAGVLLLTPSATASEAAATREPRLMAAGDATGTPFATALISLGQGSYGICTAGIWKPNVLLTAAHCVIDETTGGYIDPNSFVVVNPGSPFRVTTSGVEGATGVKVVRSFVVDGFQLSGADVPANDIAYVVLDQPIGSVTFSRLATTVELARWLQTGVPVSALGYGFPSPIDRTTDVPRGAALPIARVLDDFRGSSGLTVLSSKLSGIDACSGDSGGPRYVIENDAPLLLANIAGGSCNGFPGTGVIGFTGMSYRPLANQALTVAGLPTIPSRPVEVKASRVADSTTVWWNTPEDSAQTVVGYDVLDSTGALLCSTSTTSCAFPTGVNGVEGMSVRARNAQGEGDAALSPEAEVIQAEAPSATVRKAKTKKKPVRINITAVDYPAVNQYRVTTPQGKTVCTIDPAASPLQCTVKRGKGRYRFRVVAVTPQGESVPSAMSKAVRVR